MFPSQRKKMSEDRHCSWIQKKSFTTVVRCCVTRSGWTSARWSTGMFHLPCLLPAATLIQKTTHASTSLSSPNRGQSASSWRSKVTQAPLRRRLLLREALGRCSLVASSSVMFSSLGRHQSGMDLRRCTLGQATWKPRMVLGPRTRQDPLSRLLLTGVACSMLTCRCHYHSRLAAQKDARQ
jgi:hypothetical protein